MIGDRVCYQSTHKVSWLRLPILLCGSVLIAAIAAIVLSGLFAAGWYLIILVPCILAMLIGASVAGLVGLSHCRNRWLAGAVGVLTGASSYLGYYYLSIVAITGVWLNPIGLPAIIQFRMQTDIARDVGRVRDKEEKAAPFMNWFAFAIEAAGCVGAPAFLAYKRSRRAYCEPLSQWMACESKPIPPGYGTEGELALRNGTLHEWISTIPAVSNPQGCDTLTLEYVLPASGGSPLDYPVYFSVQSAKPNKQLLSQLQLYKDELTLLLQLFPKASSLLASHDAEIGHLVEGIAQQRAADVVQRHAPRATAQVKPVPEPYCRLLQDKNYKWKVNLIGLTPLLLFVGGIGSACFGAWLFNWGEGPVEPSRLGPGIGAIVIGALMFFAGGYAGLKLLGVFESMWINRRFRKVIQRRRGVPSWVLQTDSELVGLTPRESFLKIGLTMTSDVLFMKLDDKERCIYLIGDKDDYVIPVDAIMEVEPVMFFHPADKQNTNELWYTRLLVYFGSEVREMLLNQPHLSFWPSTNTTRRHKEAHLCERISTLKAAY